MKVDEIISRPTATSGRAVVLVSALVLYVKWLDVRVEELEIFQKIQITGSKLDWAALIILSYLAYTHLTNWAVDRGLEANIGGQKTMPREGEPFGDDQDSWDNPHTLRAHLQNAWIAGVGAGFGYSLSIARISLIYVLHLFLPSILCISALGTLMLGQPNFP